MTVPRKALLVEDEPLVAMLVVDLLGELGFEVIEAPTAKKALEAARADAAGLALAIIDLGLPDAPGETVVADLKALRADLPVIVASGSGSGQNPATFERFEKIAILPKPYEFKGLAEAIKSLGVVVA